MRWLGLLMMLCALAVPAIAEAQWVGPFDHALNGSAWSNDVAIATNDAGDSVIAYVELAYDRRANDFTGVNTWVRYRSAGGRFSKPELVNRSRARGGFPIDAGIDADGNAIVVYAATEMNEADGYQSVREVRHPAGGAWTKERTLAAPPGYRNMSDLFVAVNPKGDVALSYDQSGPYERMGATGTTTDGLGSPFPVGAPSLANVLTILNMSGSTVAIDDAGDVIWVWKRYTTADAEHIAIETRAKPAGEPPGPVEALDPDIGYFPSTCPTVGMSASGEAVVLRWGTPGITVQHRSVPSGNWGAGAWGPEEYAGDKYGAYTCPLRLSVAPDGAATVMYQASGDDYQDLAMRATSAASGATFHGRGYGSQEVVPSGQPVPFAELGVSPGGDESLIYGLDDGTVGARLRPAGASAFGPVVELEDLADGHSYATTLDADLAMTSAGDVLGLYSGQVCQSSCADAVDGALRLAAFDVSPPEVRELSVSEPVAATVPAEFAAQVFEVSGEWTMSWDFGDGATGEGDEVEHAFAAPGAYEVVATARDATGREDAATVTVTVGAAPAITPSPSPSPSPSPEPSASSSPEPELSPSPTPEPHSSASPSPEPSASPSPTPEPTTTPHSPAFSPLFSPAPVPPASAYATPRTGYGGLRARFRVKDGVTKVRTLRLLALPAYTFVRVSCNGRDCPRARLIPFHYAPGPVALAVPFRRRALRPGDRVVVQLAHPLQTGRRIVFTVRRGRRPLRRTSCLAPASLTRSACGPAATRHLGGPWGVPPAAK